MNRIEIFENKDNILLKIPKDIYSKKAILDCLYWYTKDNKIKLSSDENSFIVKIQSKNCDLSTLKYIYDNIENDLIDFELRKIIAEETKNVRDLIIAKAFANGYLDNIEDK